MKLSLGNSSLAWLATAGAVLAVGWQHCFGEPVPLPGLGNLSSPSIGWPIAVASLVMAVFLSTPRFQSRDRLLICAGVAIGLFGVLVVYVSPVFASVFAFIAGNIIRETKHA